MKFFSENHSGDVNNHSGRLGFFIHFSPESLFTSRRNPYSHHSGTIIHMPRNPQLHGDFATAFRQAAPGSSSSANFRMAEDYRPMFLGRRPLDKALSVR
jgi:hypothetical protein